MRLRLKIRELAEAQGLDRAKLARCADVTYQMSMFLRICQEVLCKLMREYCGFGQAPPGHRAADFGCSWETQRDNARLLHHAQLVE